MTAIITWILTYIVAPLLVVGVTGLSVLIAKMWNKNKTNEGRITTLEKDVKEFKEHIETRDERVEEKVDKLTRRIERLLGFLEGRDIIPTSNKEK